MNGFNLVKTACCSIEFNQQVVNSVEFCAGSVFESLIGCHTVGLKLIEAPG